MYTCIFTYKKEYVYMDIHTHTVENFDEGTVPCIHIYEYIFT